MSFLISQTLHAQSVYKLRADSVLLTNPPGNAELIIENSTKQVPGVLYNKGNGRTEFRRFVQLSDSSFALGTDTIRVNISGSARSVYDSMVFYQNKYFQQGGNSFGTTATIGINEGRALNLRTNGIDRIRIHTNGLVSIGDTNVTSSLLYVAGNMSIRDQFTAPTITASNKLYAAVASGFPRFYVQPSIDDMKGMIGTSVGGGVIIKWNNPEGSYNTDLGWASSSNSEKLRIGRYTNNVSPVFTPSMVLWRTGGITVNSETKTPRILYIRGSVGINKDSLPLINEIGTNQFLVQDTTTGQLGRTNLSPTDNSLFDLAGKNSLQTSNASATTISSFAPVNGQAGLLECRIIAQGADGATIAVFNKSISFRKKAGAIYLGSLTSLQPDEIDAGLAGCSVDLLQSGNNILVQVSGLAASSIYWKANYNVVINTL
ncbi:MAG: hypothetical protein P0Y53_18950 [Candidatus Pseudobacter hemicellulosilyticus]|uniref:Uncharacterized protein n=1 Tax=Candidatus Pseudobacter hemicellulosilyticus TaxID=3121375 RepID=A0AAJ5WPU7_9BACT|nr:MAG: hypothetical protein P0Y53_18950 [Pseudobacter sp.]